jgi:iron complex transport system permease protein
MAVFAPAAPRRPRGRVAGKGAGLALALVALAFAALLSLAVGARSVPLGEVIEALRQGGSSKDATIVAELRVPRTLLGIVVGVALGLAGALMQALTRNPLADPGLLGINAGAAAAVVIAIGILGITGTTAYVWFAFVGAALAAIAVYAVGSAGRGGPTPVRLALAGTALSAALTAVIYGITLTDERLLRQYNLWSIGALGGRGRTELEAVVPFVAVAAVAAILLARPLNALALGDDSARSLGAHVGRTRMAAAAAITLLCGAATAAAGPIWFLGLIVPHAARAICGPDQRWVLVYSAILGATLLLVADVLGRIAVRPSELEAGLMLAAVGAPLFIALVRGKRIAAL